MPLAAAGARLG